VAERAMHRASLRVGAPVALAEVALLPVERVRVQAQRSAGSGAWFSASREPVALVVCDAAGVRAAGIESTAISLEELCEQVCGLAAAIEALRGTASG